MSIKYNGTIESTSDIEFTTVIDELSDEFGYISNSETKADFVMRNLSQKLADFVNDVRLRNSFTEARNNVVKVEVSEVAIA